MFVCGYIEKKTEKGVNMKILTKANYLEYRDTLDIYEKNCGKDTVDRSDYITAEEQYYRLVLAGVQLKRAREEMFDFDSDLEEYKTDRKFERYMDKISAVEKYREKMKQYNTVKSQHERLAELHKRYLEEMKQIELENKIKNDLHKETTQAIKKE